MTPLSLDSFGWHVRFCTSRYTLQQGELKDVCALLTMFTQVSLFILWDIRRRNQQAHMQRNTMLVFNNRQRGRSGLSEVLLWISTVGC